MQFFIKALKSQPEANNEIFAGRKKVLIVEDDPIAQAIWASMVGKLDAKAIIFWATSAEEAASLIDHRKALDDAVDFVVADVNLTGKRSGIDLWRTHGSGGVAFLFASSIDATEFRALARPRPTHAAPHLVSKPLNMAECLEICSVLLRRQSRSRSA